MRFIAESVTALVVTIAISMTASPLAIADASGVSAPASAAMVSTVGSFAREQAPNSPESTPITTAPAPGTSTAGDGSAGSDHCGLPSEGTSGTAPAITAADGAIQGTSTGDLVGFARAFNSIRGEHCLDPVPLENFRYSSCMEERLVWMASDPSTDPASAWGHAGSVRSDGVPSVGCDGNLAGGTDNTAVTVAQKWWDSPAHRASLYRPDIPTGTAGYCVDFAMTHGGVPNESLNFVRAAARWYSC